jgi:hypothetical protein
MHLSVQIRRFIIATFVCAAVVFGGTFLFSSGRAQAGQRQVTHTCSAPDRQFLNTVSTNMTQLAYWSDSLVQQDVAPGIVVKQARAESKQVGATSPTDPTLKQARGLLERMFTAYARAIHAKFHGGNAGIPMRTAYLLANGVHDLLIGAQPALAARGCDPAMLLR